MKKRSTSRAPVRSLVVPEVQLPFELFRSYENTPPTNSHSLTRLLRDGFLSLKIMSPN